MLVIADLDGFNWDRVTMKCVRKVLSRANPRNLIDHYCMQTFSNPYGECGFVSVALNSMAVSHTCNPHPSRFPGMVIADCFAASSICRSSTICGLERVQLRPFGE